MNVTYIDHSCFMAQTKDAVFIFDYYKGTLPDLPHDKKLFFFSSHAHHDHFNNKILDYKEEYKDVTYILSEDIRTLPVFSSYLKDKNLTLEGIHFVKEHEEIQFNSLPLTVKTLTSTDEGVAFILTTEDTVIYHAGDLNWWSWEGETQAEYIDMTSRFKKEIQGLKNMTFDIAFLPLDPRQEGRFWWGFDHFMRETNTKAAFPMHMWGDYSVIPKLKALDRAKDYKDKVIEITKENQSFTIK